MPHDARHTPGNSHREAILPAAEALNIGGSTPTSSLCACEGRVIGDALKYFIFP